MLNKIFICLTSIEPQSAYVKSTIDIHLYKQKSKQKMQGWSVTEAKVFLVIEVVFLIMYRL
jgi:hypothetical protein